ncbi:9661_t:CDS:2 [Entrophospora sp. SA101]|nr:9661_t:CDS:2 [Entrophospora sp. SA101]
MEFGAGPAMIPQEVLEKVQLELLNYNNTGILMVVFMWSSKAFEEAKRLYNNINVVIDAKKFNGSYGSIPSKERWKFNGSKAAYVYYCDNETVNGVEFIMFLK